MRAATLLGGSLDTRVVPAMPALLQVVFVMEYAEAGPVAQVLPQGPVARRLCLRHAVCVVRVPALPLCHAMSCHAISCHAMPCHLTSCHAMPCLIGGASLEVFALPCPRSRTS